MCHVCGDKETSLDRLLKQLKKMKKVQINLKYNNEQKTYVCQLAAHVTK